MSLLAIWRTDNLMYWIVNNSWQEVQLQQRQIEARLKDQGAGQWKIHWEVYSCLHVLCYVAEVWLE